MDSVNIHPTLPSLDMNAGFSTKARQTSNIDFSTQLKRAAGQGMSAAGQTLGMAAPFVPGGAVLSAVVQNAGGNMAEEEFDGVGSQGGINGFRNMSPANTVADMESMQQTMWSQNIYMLGLQRKFQQMSEQFNTISNILKTKHDTEKNSIANIR